LERVTSKGQKHLRSLARDPGGKTSKKEDAGFAGFPRIFRARGHKMFSLKGKARKQVGTGSGRPFVSASQKSAPREEKRERRKEREILYYDFLAYPTRKKKTEGKGTIGRVPCVV